MAQLKQEWEEFDRKLAEHQNEIRRQYEEQLKQAKKEERKE